MEEFRAGKQIDQTKSCPEKNLLTAISRTERLWPSATLCNTIYKSFKKSFALIIDTQYNAVKRG
jgi:hypothetical protein